MKTHNAVKLLVLVVLLGLGYFLFFTGKGGDAVSLGERVGTPGPVEAARPAELEVAEAEKPTSAPAERVEARLEPVARAVRSEPWHGELAGLVGRVVESDGTPVSGIRVALFELDTEILFSGGLPEEGAEELSLELDETITDPEGHFVLGGARAPSFHALGVDLGGPRATMRVLDSALVHRERTDVGDVVLAPYGVLTGRVVDESGAGVAGARIRVGPYPEEILVAAPYELRADSLLAISMLVSSGDGRSVIEPPRWLAKVLDELPVPTTTSDAQGYFRLEGVAQAEVVGGVDKPGHAGIPLGPIDMEGAAEKDLGDLVLSRGRTVEGVVEDAVGDPVAGVEVFAGAEVPAGFVAILQPCGRSDAEGRFTLRGVPAQGQVVAVTRRSKGEPWVGEVTTRHDSVLLSLETAIQLTVRVQDDAGEPVSKAQILLEPAPKGKDSMGFAEMFAFLPSPVEPLTAFREVEPGRYVNPSVTPGSYEITARVSGLARGHVGADLWKEESEVVVTCPAGEYVAVQVVDAATQEPVPGARASILHAGTSRFERLVTGVTDDAGRARLGPVDVQAKQKGIMPDQAILVVRHPRHADHSSEVEPGQGEVVVALDSGGALAGQVRCGDSAPTRPYMLMVQYTRGTDGSGTEGFLEMFHMPRFGLSDLDGAFRVDDLAAGEYEVQLLERFLDRDPAELMSDGFEPMQLYRGTVAIASGQTTQLDIDLTSTGRGPTARIRGRVRVDGREIEGADVTVSGNGTVRTTTDAWGRFETEEFTVWSEVWVTITGDVQLPTGPASRMQIFKQSFELHAGEVREIDVDLVPVALQVEVVEAGQGGPISGARVFAHTTEEGGGGPRFSEGFSTDAAGQAGVWVPGSGEYTVSARAAGFANGSTQVTVRDGGQLGVTRLELSRAVPCAGRVSVPSAATPEGGFSYLAVMGNDGSYSSGVMLSPPDYEFELDGLTAGTYQAWIYVGGRIGEQATFELGPDGDSNLILDFVPQGR